MKKILMVALMIIAFLGFASVDLHANIVIDAEPYVIEYEESGIKTTTSIVRNYDEGLSTYFDVEHTIDFEGYHLSFGDFSIETLLAFIDEVPNETEIGYFYFGLGGQTPNVSNVDSNFRIRENHYMLPRDFGYPIYDLVSDGYDLSDFYMYSINRSIQSTSSKNVNLNLFAKDQDEEPIDNFSHGRLYEIDYEQELDLNRYQSGWMYNAPTHICQFAYGRHHNNGSDFNCDVYRIVVPEITSMKVSYTVQNDVTDFSDEGFNDGHIRFMSGYFSEIETRTLQAEPDISFGLDIIPVKPFISFGGPSVSFNNIDKVETVHDISTSFGFNIERHIDSDSGELFSDETILTLQGDRFVSPLPSYLFDEHTFSFEKDDDSSSGGGGGSPGYGGGNDDVVIAPW